MTIKIPELSLVLMIGTSSSGKSTFAKKYFKPTEIISSDYCRALVSDDENNLNATSDAFDTLYFIVGKRLKRGLLTVVDATNIRGEDRQRLIAIARQYHCLATAIVLDIPEKTLLARHEQRTDRDFSKHVMVNQIRSLKSSLKGLKREGFHISGQRSKITRCTEGGHVYD